MNEDEDQDGVEDQGGKDGTPDRFVRNAPEPGSPVEGGVATAVAGSPCGYLVELAFRFWHPRT